MNFCTRKVIRLDSKLLPFQIPVPSLIVHYFSCHLTTVTHLSVFTLRIASACCGFLRKNLLSGVFIRLYIMGNITPILNKRHFVIIHSFLWCKHKKCVINNHLWKFKYTVFYLQILIVIFKNLKDNRIVKHYRVFKQRSLLSAYIHRHCCWIILWTNHIPCYQRILIDTAAILCFEHWWYFLVRFTLLWKYDYLSNLIVSFSEYL